jgi:hypothetical protein
LRGDFDFGVVGVKGSVGSDEVVEDDAVVAFLVISEYVDFVELDG